MHDSIKTMDGERRPSVPYLILISAARFSLWQGLVAWSVVRAENLQQLGGLIWNVMHQCFPILLHVPFCLVKGQFSNVMEGLLVVLQNTGNKSNCDSDLHGDEHRAQGRWSNSGFQMLRYNLSMHRLQIWSNEKMKNQVVFIYAGID